MQDSIELEETQIPPPEKLVGALVNGLSVLRYLAATGSAVGVTRVARELELNSSTCFNILKTLVHEGLVTFDEDTKTYAIGMGLVALAKGSLTHASYVRMLHPQLEEIAAKHRVTATLWQKSSKERVTLVDLAENNSTVRVQMSIGQRLPEYVAALGRCMAAYSGLSEESLRERVAHLRWEEEPSFEEYYAEVLHVRDRGYAVDNGNYVKGVTTVSVPIIDASNKAIMAISAVGFTAQMNKAAIRQLGEDMHVRAQKISRALSGRIRS